MSSPSLLLSRVVAKVIDLILVAIAIELLHKAGFWAGIVYILISDGLFDGRSLGKMLLKLQVLREDGYICTVKESILRNISIAFSLLLWKIPFIGWLLFISVLTIEFIVFFGSDKGRRLGDELAKTYVQEIK